MPFWLEDFTDNPIPTEVPAPAHIAQDSDSEHSTKVAAKSRKHGIFTHFPKDRNCDVCLRTKITKASCRRRIVEALPRAEKFGDLITADHKVLNEGYESRDNHRITMSFMRDVNHSMEFGEACEVLSWNHHTSTPHRSDTNFIAERAVRRVKEGTSAVLPQSGLDERWWSDSMECFCYLRNVQDLLADGKTPFE